MAVSGEKGLARVWRMKSMEKERGWDAGMKNSNRNRRGEQTQDKSEKQRLGGQHQMKILLPRYVPHSLPHPLTHPFLPGGWGVTADGHGVSLRV